MSQQDSYDIFIAEYVPTNATWRNQCHIAVVAAMSESDVEALLREELEVFKEIKSIEQTPWRAIERAIIYKGF